MDLKVVKADITKNEPTQSIAERFVDQLEKVCDRVSDEVDGLVQDAVDRYGRLLRYVEHSGIDVGRRQIPRGRARVYVYNHNPFRRVAGYHRAQRNARAPIAAPGEIAAGAFDSELGEMTETWRRVRKTQAHARSAEAPG